MTLRMCGSPRVRLPHHPAAWSHAHAPPRGWFLGLRIPDDGVPAVEAGLRDDERFSVGRVFCQDFAGLFGLLPHRFGICEEYAIVALSSVDADDEVREKPAAFRVDQAHAPRTFHFVPVPPAHHIGRRGVQ